MGKRVAGICYFKVDGEQLELEGDIEVPMKKTKKTSKPGASGFYTEEVVTPFVSGKFTIPDDFPRQKVLDGKDLTITVELANGWVYTLSGGYNVDDANLNGTEGNSDLRWDGKNGDFQ